MDGFDQSTTRDANGRFLPGQSGNPVGKKPGTKNRATLLAEDLAEGEAEALLRLVVEKALGGDGVAARFLLGRIYAKPRGRAIRLALPKGARPGDVVAAFNATLSAMAAGEITPEEALVITRVLEGRVRALEAWRVERKLTGYLGPVPGDAMFEGMAAEEEAENLLPSSFENPLPLSRKPEVSADATGEAELRREHAGEGRVRAGAKGSESSDGAAVAPIPSPRPSPACGRGSDGGAPVPNSDPLHFACNAAEIALVAAEERRARRRLAAAFASVVAAPETCISPASAPLPEAAALQAQGRAAGGASAL